MYVVLLCYSFLLSRNAGGSVNRNHHHGWFSHGFPGQKEPIRSILITHSPHQGDLYTKRTPTPGRATGRNHKPKHPHNPNAMETPNSTTRQDPSTERRAYKLVENTWEQVLTIEGDIPKYSVRF